MTYREVNTLLAVGCYLSFIWAIQRKFVREERLPALMKWLRACGAVFIGLHLIALVATPTLTMARELIGIVGYVSSLILFWSTTYACRHATLKLAFVSSSPVTIVRHGPYRLIRHPYYTAYTVCWLSACIITGHSALYITVIIMLLFYVAAAHAEEQDFLKSAISIQYRNYLQTTGAFMPKPAGWFGGTGGDDR